MVRNEHLVASQEGPVPADAKPDTQIVVEGGIWTTLATSDTQSNGNVAAVPPEQGEVPSCHGVLLFNNLRGLLVRNITIRQSRAHGVQLSNCGDFLVDGVTFEDHRRDGVHVNGPASYGVIRNIRGVTGDDVVALNAWDWRNTAPSFGPIDHILVEGVHGNPQRVSADEIRLLPGTKTFAGGKLDCSVADCVLRDLHDIRTFKIYDQPNLELGRDNDFCDPIGTLQNVHIQKLVYDRPGPLQIAVNVDGLFLDDVQLNFDPNERAIPRLQARRDRADVAGVQDRPQQRSHLGRVVFAGPRCDRAQFSVDECPSEERQRHRSVGRCRIAVGPRGRSETESGLSPDHAARRDGKGDGLSRGSAFQSNTKFVAPQSKRSTLSLRGIPPPPSRHDRN